MDSSELAFAKTFVERLGCSNCSTSWQSPNEFCASNFVVCDGEFLGKYRLILRNMGLSGFLDSASVAGMPNCYHLVVSNNKLTGTLPRELFDSVLFPTGTLGKLYVEVDNNFITGELPANPSASSYLHVLRVSGNRLSGSIPLVYFSLPRMQQLHLNRNMFSGPLPTPPMNSSQLIDVVDFRDNALTGSIASAWNRLPNLRFISFSNNRLTGTVPRSLFLPPFERLAQFSVANNSLSGVIPSQLGALTMVRRLDLAFNSFVGPLVLPNTSESCRVAAADPAEKNLFSSCTGNVSCCAPQTVPSSQITGTSSITMARSSMAGTSSGSTLPTTTAALGSTSAGISSLSTFSSASALLNTTAALSSTSAGTTASFIIGDSEVPTALIGGVVGAVCLLLLIAVLVGIIVLRMRSRHREQAEPSGASSQYNVLPPPQVYGDVEQVRKRSNHYDSPTSKLEF